MQLAQVIGTTTATIKDPSITGRKLLIVQPLLADRRSPDGFPLIAVDGVGAGMGERVMITSDGRSARELLNTDRTPVRWSVIALPDS